MNFVEEYLRTVENEVSIDEGIFKLQGQAAINYFFFPRPAKWLKRNNGVLRHIFGAVFVFWNIGGAYLFFTIEALRLFIMSVGADKADTREYLGKKVGLAFSARALTVIPQALKAQLDVWIYFPWVTQGGISILSFAKKQDFVSAFKLSIQAFKDIKKNKATMNWILHTYTAYRWFLSRIILFRIHAESYYTAEHFDRWASLAGFVASEQQKPLAIIQHGILTGLNEKNEKQFPFNIQNKIEGITSLYVYDVESKNIFLEKIINEKMNPVVYFFKPTIELTKIDENENAVLFVGNTLCEDFHISVYKKLKQRNEVVAYYKPHPTVGPGTQVKNLDWIIISDKEFFPEVKVIISYPSTLVEEYANAGVPSVVHQLNATELEVTELISKVETVLR